MKAVRDFRFFFGGCLFAKDIWARSMSENSDPLTILNRQFHLEFGGVKSTPKILVEVK